jgi:hypothetical protein
VRDLSEADASHYIAPVRHHQMGGPSSSPRLGMTDLLFFKRGGEFFALVQQLLRYHAAQGIEKCFMCGNFVLPLLVIDTEKFGNAFVIEIQS